MAGIVLFFRWRTMSTKPKVQWKPVLTKLGVDARPGSVDCDGAGQHALTKANEAQRLLDQYYKVQDRVMSAMEAHAANIARLVRWNHSYCEQHENLRCWAEAPAQKRCAELITHVWDACDEFVALQTHAQAQPQPEL